MDFNVKSMPCRMHKSSWLRKSLNIMRCIVLFILLGTLQTFASLSYSQSVKLSLNMENTTVQDVLSMIEQKCDFYFPGIVQRDEIVIGVSASGRDHKKARKMREDIAAFLREEEKV